MSAETVNNHPAPGKWSMLPTLARDIGALRSLTKAQARVYIALDLRADWKVGGNAIASQEKLAHETGVSVRSVRQALLDLEGFGLVRKVEQGNGRGWAGVYRIETGNAEAGVRDSISETRKLAAQNPEALEPIPGSSTTETRNPASLHQNKKNQNSNRGDASAAGVCSGEKCQHGRLTCAALIDGGIGKPKRCQISARIVQIMPDESGAKLVKDVAANGREKGKGSGVIVLDIETAIDKSVKRKESDARWAGLTDEAKSQLQVLAVKRFPNLNGRHIDSPEIKGAILRVLDERQFQEVTHA